MFCNVRARATCAWFSWRESRTSELGPFPSDPRHSQECVLGWKLSVYGLGENFTPTEIGSKRQKVQQVPCRKASHPPPQPLSLKRTRLLSLVQIAAQHTLLSPVYSHSPRPVLRCVQSTYIPFTVEPHSTTVLEATLYGSAPIRGRLDCF